MNREQIKALALANGFKLKAQPDGSEDLNPYVYEFVDALMAPLQAELKRQQDENSRLLFGNRYNADMYRQINDERKRLQAEVERLRGAHSFPHVSRIGNHLTLVFDADELSNDEKRSLFERARAMSWSHAIDDRKAVERERDQLKAMVPPKEYGANRYGLDCSYFRGVINRELNRPLVDFKPDELARVLMRMAVTADAAVLSEPEFLRRVDLTARDAEVIKNSGDYLHKMGLINSNAHLMLKHHANLMLCASN